MALSRKKKNRLTMIIIFGSIAVLLAGYMLVSGLLQKNATEKPAETTDGQPPLSSFSADELSSITINSAGFSGTIVREYKKATDENGQTISQALYRLEGNDAFPLDAKKAEKLFTTVVLAAAECITEAGDPAEYGLVNPKLSLTLTALSGKSETIAIGNEAGLSEKGGYYANVDGSSKIYLTQSSMYSALSYNEAGWIALEAPTIDTASINRVTYTDIYGTKILEKSADRAIKLFGAAYSNWTAKLVNGRQLFLDDETVGTYLYDSFRSVSLVSAVDYRAENFAKYGLDKPQATVVISTVTQDDESGEITGSREYKIYLGARYTDDYYCIAFEGDSRTYLVAAAHVDELFILNTDSMLYKNFCSVDIGSVATLTVTTQAASDRYTFTLGKKEENGRDENTVLEAVKNGEKLDNTDAFIKFYQSLLALDSDTYIKSNPETEADKILELKFERVSEEYEEMTVSFENYNDNYALVRINGEAVFTYSRRNLEELLKVIP